MNKQLLIVISALLVVSCKNSSPVTGDADIKYEGDTVYLSENSHILPKIKTYIISEQDFSARFSAPGMIKAITGRIAEIGTPFDGRVGKSFVALGQKVTAGAPLFEIHSADFFEATKSYFQSLHTKKMKESVLKRQRDLVANGVGAIRDLEEAETEYELALAEYENSIAELKMYNLNPSEIKLGEPLRVPSPISGEVVKRNIVMGQYVKSDDQPLAVVADLREVWVAAQVKERFINSISSQDKVEIISDNDPNHIITGTITYIGELVDEDTRSIEVLITCDNSDKKLRPGTYASVNFISKPKSTLVVPTTALLQSEDKSYIFLAKEGGKYIKQEVTSISIDQNHALITSGLESGDTIVAQGGIYLIEI